MVDDNPKMQRSCFLWPGTEYVTTPLSLSNASFVGYFQLSVLISLLHFNPHTSESVT